MFPYHIAYGPMNSHFVVNGPADPVCMLLHEQ